MSFPSSERVKESPNPPNPSCCRSRGGMRGWPLPRPTHAPATTLKTNGNSAPIKPMSFPSSAWECVPRSSASHSRSRNRPRNKHSPRRKAGLLSHRSPGGILSHALLWSSVRSRNQPQDKRNSARSYLTQIFTALSPRHSAFPPADWRECGWRRVRCPRRVAWRRRPRRLRPPRRRVFCR